MLNFFLNVHLRYKIRKKLFFLFKNKKNFVKTNSKNLILIEFNKWSCIILSMAYVLKILREEIDAKIYAYPENGFLRILKPNFFTKIKWQIGVLFKLKSFGIYSALGTNKFINVENYERKALTLKAKNKLSEIFSKVIDRSSFLNLHLENILVGDLFYDTYLKIYHKETIDIHDKNFILFLEKSILYFYFWHNFFKKNKVKAIIVSQAVYNSSIPLRIGIKFNSKCISASPFYIFSLSKKMMFYHNQFLLYKKNFLKLSSLEKTKGLKIVKKKLKEYFNGAISLPEKATYLRHSTFVGNKEKPILFNKKSKKIKVLICAHRFSDAPHSLGIHLYDDYYQWLMSLLKISTNTNYEWYIKTHPVNSNFIDKTTEIIRDLIKTKYQNVKLISPETPHRAILKIGINFVLTCNGSVASEYPYFDIPSINASRSNPHVDFSFSISPYSRKIYENFINNLKKFKSKIKINKKEILQYYLMSNFYYSPSWFAYDWLKIINSFKNKNDIYRDVFYNYWMNNFSLLEHNKKLETLRNFIKSNDYVINFNHSRISFLDHLKKFN
jgi:hypothetical protein